MSDDCIRITFVRHGQTESNQEKRWQGQGDSRLSALGVAQARLLGARLAGRKYTHVVSSDLSRAVDTARATGFEFSTDRALREFDIGNWEGLTAEQVAAQYPGELERLRMGEDVALGGGESYAAFSARIDAAIDALRARLAPGDHALVVCHGGVIGTALSGALGLRVEARGSAREQTAEARGSTREETRARRWATARAANTSITELSYSKHGVLLHVFNDTLHLLPLGAWPAHAEQKGSVALMCDVAEEHHFGEFVARYPAAEPGRAGAASAAGGSDLSARLAELLARHPEERVALQAESDSVHAWAEATLFGDIVPTGKLAPPRAGSVCHAGRMGERALLLDYGLMR